MLVDIIVKGGQILAAKPASNIATPIILVELVEGVIIPTVKWSTSSTESLSTRLANRTFGRLLGKAYEKALKVVMDNGTLNISGEYGSIEIDDKDFEVDSELQKQFIAQAL